MSTNFSIGEMSKLYNISIRTLRHYDKIGLINPIYTNKENGYRYYSFEQFVHLQLIKHYKSIGLSLDEIKLLLNTDSSIESISTIIKKQQVIVDNKINELTSIKNHLNFLQERLDSTTKYEFNKVFIKHNKKRKYIIYSYLSKTVEEIEINIRKAIIDIEHKYGHLCTEITLRISLDSIKRYNKVIYNDILIFLDESIDIKEENTITLPAGDYVTIHFDDNCADNRCYYNKIINYAKQNNIELEGNFNEICIMPRIDVNRKEKTLVQLEILKKTSSH